MRVNGLFLTFFLAFLWVPLTAYAAPPAADISFLVVDLKYNEQDGVKICEIQQGLGCTFKGAAYFNGKEGGVAKLFASFLSRYNAHHWYVSKGLSREFKKGFSKAKGFKGYASLDSLLKSKKVKKRASLPVRDATVLTDYNGIFVIEYHSIDKSRLDAFNGALLLNAAFLPSFGEGAHTDKLLMSRLFTGDEALCRLKPHWGIFEKGFSTEHAATILGELSAELLVIKPRTGLQGKGVIILHREDLAATLRYIFSGSPHLRNDPDKAYWYWAEDPHSNYIVEEFVPSVPVVAPQLGKGSYDGTMRVVVALTHDKGVVDAHFLYNFWKLPELSLEMEGSLNEKHKSYSRSDNHYALVDRQIETEVHRQLKEGLLVLYQRILSEQQ